MDHRELFLQSIGDYERQLNRALRDLSQEEAMWMATPDTNHISWILWHIGRMEDMWGWYLRGTPGYESDTRWIEGGWAEKFGLDAQRNGAGDSIEQVREFPDIPLADVVEYWQACRAQLVKTVKNISADQFEVKRPEIWTHAPDRAPTLPWVLGRIPVENSQHVGQIAFIRGLYAAQTS